MKQRLLYGILVLFVCMTSNMRAWALEQDADGVYQIGNAADLVAFSSLVNAGEFEANAVLTANIDMADEISSSGWTAIGDWGGVSGTSSACYKGHFDGKGHVISGFNTTATHNYYGIFGVISTGALIENFTVYGTVSCGFKTMGVVGYARDATPTIRNIHSYLNIENTLAGGRHGGILGSSVNGTIVVENCTYSGTLNVGELTGNYGGIVGYVNNNAAAILNITNCLFDGKLLAGSEIDAQCGGIVGYSNAGVVTIKGCLSLGTITSGNGNVGQFFGRLNGSSSVFANNCYVGDEVNGTAGTGKAGGTVPVKVTEAQLSDGEACFLLNGDQTTIGWYQTLGSDELPVLDATHAQVYMNGRLHCNGDIYEGSTFSNENVGIVKDEHNFVDGFCEYCWLFDENYLTPNADGFYEIANAKQMVWFQQKVNNGELGANAILTGDVDFVPVLEQRPWTSIGTSETNAFTGTFDGQNHKITGFKMETSVSGGLFGCVTNATIKNFSVSGILTVTGGTGAGLVGWPSNSSIRNIHSTLEIEVPVNGVHHVGGVVGSARGGNHVDGCTFSGTMRVAVGSTDNFAGVVAYLGGDSISNCANYGTITFLDPGCAAGGVAGYLNNTTTYLRNCLNYGKVVCEESSSPKYGGAIIGRIKNNWSDTRVVNNYWLEGSAYGPSRKDDGTSPETASAEGSSDDEIASGEVVWKLNNESFVDPVWRQTLGEDDYPMPYGNGAIVYQTSTGYDCISADRPESFASFRDDVIAKETDYIENEELVAYKGLISQYKQAIQSWEDIDNVDDFFVAYKAAAEIKEAIELSSESYANYVNACKAAADYIKENGLEGEYTDFLVTYLEESIEPNSDYPNGSSSYIMENLNLDNDAIAAEIAFVNQMLENALAGGVTPGTEITRLMVNPTFTDGEDSFAGWNTEANDGASFSTGGVAEIMKIARGKNGSFDINQTLTDLTNGIYMMSINGLFLSGGDIYSEFNAGQFYMNNTYNYAMTSSEDIIAEADAQDQVNCLLSDDEEYKDGEELIGYVPSTFKGCSYAYNAGRYQNFCATEVTDGTLTIGMRSLGTGIEGDWLPFGNLHVYYLGNAEEANEKLAEVLDGFVARAQTIVNLIASDGYEGVTQRPNISNELKGRLDDAIASAAEATTGEAKMTLINTFSALFGEVYTCRKAYIAMDESAISLINSLDNLVALGFIPEDDYEKWTAEVYDAIGHFSAGTVTTEEALAIADRLNVMGKLMPQIDGIYQISDAKQLQIFSVLVNNGQTNINAVLTSDIDMSELGEEAVFEPIGRYTTQNDKISTSLAYTGVFDGQGYSIKNFIYNASDNGNGLFGLINNASVKNFRISGTLTSDGFNYNGVVGIAEGTSVVSGIYSDMDVNVSNFSAHSGGIVGGCSTSSKVLVENCEYAGTLTHKGKGDCQAGILGYTYSGGVKNCLFTGTIIGETSKYGGMLAYCKIAGFKGIQNCLSIGKIVSNSTQQAAIIASWNCASNTSNIKNNYYCLQEGSTATIAVGTHPETCEAPNEVNAEQLASGEVCFKLNAGQETPVWYQTIGVDPHPVLDSTHGVVLYDEVNGYYNEGLDPDGIENANVNANDNLNNAAIYNLSGQRLTRLQKGINIVGGKKILY